MISGTCHCQSIQFQVDRPQLNVRRCYCDTCRKLSGADYSSVARVARDKFQICAGAEHLVSYQSRPGKQRFYCRRCYSPIYVVTDKEPDFLRIRTGLLDGKANVVVSGHMWVAEKPTWVVIDDGLAIYRGDYDGPPDPL